MACRVDDNAQGTLLHHGFNLLISVELCVCRTLSLDVHRAR